VPVEAGIGEDAVGEEAAGFEGFESLLSGAGE